MRAHGARALSCPVTRKRDPIAQTRERFIAAFACAFRTGKPVELPESVFTTRLQRLVRQGLTVFDGLEVSESERQALYKLYHEDFRACALTPKNIDEEDDQLAFCTVDYIADRC